MHILLHGGTVVSAEGTAVLDVLIEDGRIAAVGGRGGRGTAGGIGRGGRRVLRPAEGTAFIGRAIILAADGAVDQTVGRGPGSHREIPPSAVGTNFVGCYYLNIPGPVRQSLCPPGRYRF